MFPSPFFVFIILYTIGMDDIYRIRYVDAQYTYAKSIGKTGLPPHEAYGYIIRNADTIVVIFIKKRGTDCEKIVRGKEDVIKGLVIPNTALMSVVETYTTTLLENLDISSQVTVTWRDVRYVANMPVYECAIMQTEGVLYRIEKNHIVIKDPRTIRTYPMPMKNHPENGHPTYLVIPTSFITDINP